MTHLSHLHTLKWWLAPVAAVILTACGGGGSASTSTSSGTVVATFIDSKVEGLAFASTSHRGVTDSNGNFIYTPGETVTFSIGSLVLGSAAPTGTKVTPANLVTNYRGTSDERVRKMLQVLQSLDQDANLDNGIQIPDWARNMNLSQTNVRLDDDGTDDSEVTSRLASGDYTVTADDAWRHFELHQDDESNASSGYDSSTGTTRVVNQPANTTGRLLASNCFQCHGTLGQGGFENIRGSDAHEVLDYLTQSARSDIMAAHAQGYTRAQLEAIIAYLQQ